METQTRHSAQDVGKYLVGPIDQGAAGPEVGAKEQGFQGNPARGAGQAPGGLREEPRFGLAPAVDGLLGVPHHRQGASCARLPAGHEAAEQVHLVLAGILEFVHQQVLQAPVQAQQEVGGVLQVEQAQGGLLQGDEVQGLAPGAELVVVGQGLPQEDHQVL